MRPLFAGLVAWLALAPALAFAQANPAQIKTRPVNDNSAYQASTAYVDQAVGLKAPLASPAFTGNASMLSGQTGPSNADGAGFTYQNTATTAAQIYGPGVPPGWYYRDGIRSSVVALPGNQAVNTNAFGYYVANRQASGGVGQNAVGLWGVTSCQVDNSACWGLNPALIDAVANGAVTSGLGRKLIGAEFDFSATSPNTIIQGVSLLGSSQVQPAGADGYSCGSLGGPAKWTHCFVVPDGVANSGLYLGSRAGPTSGIRPSLPVQFAYYNADNSGHLINLFASQDFLAIQRDDGGTGLVFGTSSNAAAAAYIAPLSANANVDLELRPTGTGQVVARSNITSTGAIKATTGAFPGAANLSALPAPTSVPAGTMMYCYNCLKPGQVSGNGTGMPLFSDGGSWYSTAGTLAAN